MMLFRFASKNPHHFPRRNPNCLVSRDFSSHRLLESRMARQYEDSGHSSLR